MWGEAEHWCVQTHISKATHWCDIFFLHFYKWSLILNLPQTTVISEKWVKGARQCLWLQNLRRIADITVEHIFFLWHVVNEVQAKACCFINILGYFISKQRFPLPGKFPLGNVLRGSPALHAPQFEACAGLQRQHFRAICQSRIIPFNI